MDFENLQDILIGLLFRNWKSILILSTISAFYYYCTANFDHFKKKGVAYVKPVLVVGNLWPRLTGKKSMRECQIDFYNYFKGQPYGGVFEGRVPILYVFDPDLIKAVLIKDFDHFVDRLSFNTNEPRYIKRGLARLKGSEWKAARSVLTPVFSPARLKNMMPLLELCSNQLIEYLKEYDQKEVELKWVTGRYTVEVIGACAFGINFDVLRDNNCHFIEMANKMSRIPRHRSIMGLICRYFMPQLIKLFNVSNHNLEAGEELMKLLRALKEDRRSTNFKKSDFLQILVDISKNEQRENDNPTQKYIMDEDTIDAQAIVFLLAGNGTSSVLLAFAIHMLVIKPEIQEKLRAHIMEITEGKELTYEILKDLDYLDGVLYETLRMYPPTDRIDRVVTKPYTFPGSNVQVDVGDMISVPAYGIHMDSDYYPEPHEFRPERFMGEEMKARPSHLFLPFGVGPRFCMGRRFGMMSVKVLMVHLMKNFKFTTCPKTEDPPTIDKRSLLLKPKPGLWVRVEKL